MNYLFNHIGRYFLFIRGLFLAPEKLSVYWRQFMMETARMGFGAIGIVSLTSVFLGAVISIQTVHNLVSPLVPLYAVGVVTRDSIIIEFAPTIIVLLLAGKIGSSIASEIGTMRVTEQIDALEIMGINASGYLVLPKILASILIFPFLVIISMFIGIMGGWVSVTVSGLMSTTDFVRGLHQDFLPFNVTFALIKTVVFAFIITSVSSYQGYYVKGGAREVGSANTNAVVYSSVLILVFDYVLTQLLLT